MRRRAFLAGAGAAAGVALVPALPAIAEAAPVPQEVIDIYAKECEAVFVRTAPSAWRCVKAGWLSPAAVDNMLDSLTRYHPVSLKANIIGVRAPTQYATIRPGIHDEVDCTLSQTKEVPVPPLTPEP